MNKKTTIRVFLTAIISVSSMAHAKPYYSFDKIVSNDYLSRNAWEYFRRHNEGMTEELMWIPYHDVNIPDSLTKSFFKIGTADYVACLLDSSIVYDTISSFYIRNSEGQGDGFYFDLTSNVNRAPNRKDAPFYFISSDVNEVRSIQTRGLLSPISKNSKIQTKKGIIDHFNLNQSDLNSIKKYLYLKDEDGISPEFFIDSFAFDFRKVHLQNIEEDLIIASAKNRYNDYVALYYSKMNKTVYIECSKFRSLFMFHDDLYIIVAGYKPGTGWRGYNLYKVTKDGFERVFSDYTYST